MMFSSFVIPGLTRDPRSRFRLVGRNDRPVLSVVSGKL